MTFYKVFSINIYNMPYIICKNINITMLTPFFKFFQASFFTFDLSKTKKSM